MTIKHFIFDLGNVMVDFSIRHMIDQIASVRGCDSDLIWDTWDWEAMAAVEGGRLPEQVYLEQVVHPFAPDWTLQDLATAWGNTYEINQPGRALFLDLKARGFGVHVLSNLAGFHVKGLLDKFPGFFDASDNNFFSFELGMNKPDVRIYEAVVARLEATPEECVFLDDNQDNVEGAQTAGLTAFCYSTKQAGEIGLSIQRLIGA
jgi:glucose-1-phosphatase